jgi:hypothetical protein
MTGLLPYRLRRERSTRPNQVGVAGRGIKRLYPPAQAGEKSIDAPKPAASNCSLAVLALLQTRNGQLPDAVRSWPVQKPSPPRWIWQTK